MRLDPDAPFKSFQKRLGSHELSTPQLNDANRKRFGLPLKIVLDAYPADRPGIADAFQGGLSYTGEWRGYHAGRER